MRDIEFRGKRKDNGGWVYGYYYSECGNYYIIENRQRKCMLNRNLTRQVSPETVGQYSGVPDKNGVKIFEGDIIKSHYANAKKADHIETVVFINGKFTAEGRAGQTGRCWNTLPDGIRRVEFYWEKQKPVYMESCEVIGNIHDNPELLEEHSFEGEE